jgi:hypothetical protein
MTSVKKFITDIITNGEIDDQILLLKVYPIFSLLHPIIKFWIDIYQKNSVSSNNYTYCEQNTLRFLKIGLYWGYIKINMKYLKKVLNILSNENIQLEIAQIIFNPYKIQKKKVMLTSSDFCTYNPPKSQMFDLLKLASTTDQKSAESNILLNNFDNISTDEFVEAINNYYLKIYNKITIHEIIYKVIGKAVGKTPNLFLLFNFFKKITNMIPSEILIKTNKKKKRIQIIKKFISIANKFLKTNNFEALYGIVAGLNNKAIQRLNDLWKPNKKHTIRFNELIKIISHDNNYNYYRNIIKEKDKYIPYLGLVFSDIDHCLQFGITDKFNKINLDIYNMIANIFGSFESAIVTIEGNFLKKKEKTIINFINNYLAIDEDCLYTISYQIQKPIAISKQKLIANDDTNQNKQQITELKDKVDTEIKHISLKLSGRFNSFRKKTMSLNNNLSNENVNSMNLS